MTIIVTGGAGFIGSNFILYLHNKYKDYKIICVDCITYAANLSNLKSIFKSKRFRFVKGNILDRKMIYKLFEDERPDFVVNFAAESHVDHSIVNPEIFFDTNIKGTSVLLDACLKYGIKRFHQVSTDEVYGELPIDNREILFSENTPISPRSPYSSSKAAADLIVKAYQNTYKLPISISRCSNNYGPYQYPEKLIPVAIISCLTNKEIPIYGTGENIRDWIYVNDHCKAIDLILHSDCLGKIYNIGGHSEISNINLVKIISNCLGIEKPKIIYTKDRLGHDKRYGVDTTKIETELGWFPETCLREGISKTVRWYIDNKAWWEDDEINIQHNMYK